MTPLNGPLRYHPGTHGGRAKGCRSHCYVPFYTNDASFGSLARRSAAQLKLLMAQGAEQGYFPKPAESLFKADKLEYEETTK